MLVYCMCMISILNWCLFFQSGFKLMMLKRSQDSLQTRHVLPNWYQCVGHAVMYSACNVSGKTIEMWKWSQQSSLRWYVSSLSASANEETELCFPDDLPNALLLSGSLILGMEREVHPPPATKGEIQFGAKEGKLVVLVVSRLFENK